MMLCFTKSRARLNNTTKTLCRFVSNNPALNLSPPFRNPAIVPFGINFIDDDLKTYLVEAKVDIDDVERMYYHQCQDDAELNNSLLPNSYESKLWGFIYGQKLVAAQYQLDTLRDDEQFMVNYLKQNIDELTMKMNRFYPSFDYKSQIEAMKKEKVVNEAWNDSYNLCLAEVLAEKPQEFISQIFAKNSFISTPTTNADYLPLDVEQEMIANYQFEWDFNSNLTSNFESYFNRISKFDNMLSPKLDALSKSLRNNFADFLLESFGSNNIDDVEYVVNVIESSSKSVINSDELNFDSLSNNDLVKNCLDLLNTESPRVLSKLFYGGKPVDDQLSGKSKDELISILSGVDNQRLQLANKALLCYEYLKYNSMTRLLITCLINEFGDKFSQFLNENGDQNIDKFNEINGDLIDEFVSFQSGYYENQNDLIECLLTLISSIQSQIYSDTDCKLTNDQIIDLSSFDAPSCFVTQILQSGLDSARQQNKILDEIKYLTLYNYITRFSSSISPLKFALFLMNPNKKGFNGIYLKNMAFQFATNSSDASNVLFDQIMAYLQQNALIDGDKLNSYKADLINAVQTELNNFNKVCVEYNNSRNNAEQSLSKITLDFNQINFEHAKSNYEPLSIHLAQFNYYSER